MHVRGFTRNPNSDVPPERRGTVAGVIDKVPYLKELGITMVELLPVQQFDPQEGNYWGYMPLNFFAPHASYASDAREARDEFRAMVRALHAAGEQSSATEFIRPFVLGNATLSGSNCADVAPATGFAWNAASLEAMTGQIYLVIVVARLVSLHHDSARIREPSFSTRESIANVSV